ncbi:hypothetical protein [Flavobacterium sp.]|uniref:hypothetical protein n=1 Tax=Flavobacterium sp. TaxID=239 RepID=UPI002629F540|nr:hypothetical protein [Flavobacterium sp.]
MKLNETQIQYLFDFTRQHYVEYYDLQSELVDHLANAIEQAISENPNLSFEQALNAEFKKFGIFGFMDVVEKRQGALTRKYHKMVWTHFMEFFRLPKIVLSLGAVVFGFYFLKSITYKEAVFASVLAVITFGLLLKMIIEVTLRRKKAEKKEKRWLFEEIMYGYGSVTSFFILPLQLIDLFYRKAVFLSDIAMWVSSFLIVAYAIVCYVMIYVIPSKAKEYLGKMYPEYLMQEV